MKKDKWIEYVKFWEYYYSRGLRGWSEFGRVVDSLSGEDSTLYVLALCVGKWHPKNKFRGLGGVRMCALCLSYSCRRCPLELAGQGCTRPFSHYELFAQALHDNADRKNTAADALYNLLISLFNKEWKRLKG